MDNCQDIFSVVIAGLALIVSVLSYIENRKTRIDYGKAHITVELMQINSKLYLVISNIGNTFAYDMQVVMPSPFVNVFQNLKTIRPGCSYRYCVLDNSDMSTYPDVLEIVINYHDRYSKRLVKKVFSFTLRDFLKMDIAYNQEYSCYDISKSF